MKREVREVRIDEDLVALVDVKRKKRSWWSWWRGRPRFWAGERWELLVVIGVLIFTFAGCCATASYLENEAEAFKRGVLARVTQGGAGK